MPIYEYDCQSCGKRTEMIQQVGERSTRICPRCGGKLKKAFSAPSIKFKGSGFYITDYTRGNSERKGEGKTAASEKSESGEKAEKSESGDKSEKAEKAEKAEKSTAGEKAEKAEKGEKRSERKKETKAKKSSEE
jgi:putative FmdB family regulatory protein